MCCSCSAPSDLGRNLLLPWSDDFQREHPQLTVRLLLGDRIADLFRQPVDIALRYGEPEDSSLIALPVAPDNARVLCAAPGYLGTARRTPAPGATGPAQLPAVHARQPRA